MNMFQGQGKGTPAVFRYIKNKGKDGRQRLNKQFPGSILWILTETLSTSMIGTYYGNSSNNQNDREKFLRTFWPSLLFVTEMVL